MSKVLPPAYHTKYDPRQGGYVVTGDREVIIYRGDQPTCDDFAWMMNFARHMRMEVQTKSELVSAESEEAK